MVRMSECVVVGVDMYKDVCMWLCLWESVCKSECVCVCVVK